jgi:hypothetical protein
MIRANGTLYWQQESNPTVQINMTEEQVDHFNEYKNRVFALGSPGYKKWGFDPNDAEQKEKYQQYLNDCNTLDQLRNFIVETSGRAHVASQKYQVVMVAPRFTFGKQVGETETAGFLYHHKTESPNQPMEQHGGEFTGMRDEWVIEKAEYDLSAAREEKFKGGMDIPQSVHGMGALSDTQNSDTCDHAVKRAIQLYRIPNSVWPPDNRIQAAQDAFDNAKNFYKSMGNEEEQPIDNSGNASQPQMPTTDPLANTNPQEQVPANAEQVQKTVPTAPAIPQKQPEEELSFAKSSKDIVSNLKKLG